MDVLAKALRDIVRVIAISERQGMIEGVDKSRPP
jgi:hypothetical protein